MENYNTLIDAIKRAAQNEQAGIRIIKSSKESEYISYKKLYTQSLQLLFGLQKQLIPKGAEIVILCKDIKCFLISFWASILGGYKAVPLSIVETPEGYGKLNRVLKDLKNPNIIVSNEKEIDTSYIKMHRTKLTVFSDIMSNHFGLITEVAANECAFIQFSSGSTSAPKGVVLTHQNLIANIRAISEGAAITKEDSTFSWMPLTHDMGLIGFHLTPLFNNINQAQMPTRLFIFRPLLWMKSVDQWRYTLLSSPNFGYRFFLDVFKKKGGSFDLRSIRLIFNGAEPINAKICREFISELNEYNLDKNAMYPVYGLAEGSLAVSMPAPSTPIKTTFIHRDHMHMGDKVITNASESELSTEIICVGSQVSSCEIIIADKEANAYPEGHIGAIFIKGPSVTKGYYQQQLNDELFRDGWLNTGDLGFIDNGELYITGRAKNVLFLKGANFYAHDIENIAEDIGIEGFWRYAAVGAMNSQNGSQELSLFVTTKIPDSQTIREKSDVLRKKLSSSIGVRFDRLIAVPKLPLTTSGKVQHHLLRDMLHQNHPFDHQVNYNESIAL